MVVKSQTEDPFEGDTVDRHLHVPQDICLLISTLRRFCCHDSLKEFTQISQFLKCCFIEWMLVLIDQVVS